MEVVWVRMHGESSPRASLFSADRALPSDKRFLAPAVDISLGTVSRLDFGPATRVQCTLVSEVRVDAVRQALCSSFVPVHTVTETFLGLTNATREGDLMDPLATSSVPSDDVEVLHHNHVTVFGALARCPEPSSNAYF